MDTGGARLTVATFNIWFDSYHARERHDAIMGLLEARRPDVIGLQEVTADSLALVLSKPWIRAEYQPSDVDGRTLDRYGVVLLSRIPARRMTLLPLPSGMGRKLLVFELEVDGMTVSVATVHLESLRESETRGVQLGLIFGQLDASEHAILMGDFNFCSSWPQENARIAPEYRDAWPTVHPDAPGFSEDPTINRMRYQRKNSEKHVRFDRILVKSPVLRPLDIELLGTQPISAELPDVFPSDHFGLFASLG
jgi:tyrosyl-DNA phosphodiesterase 2